LARTLLVALALVAQALTPDTVARRVQDRDTGRDSRSEMRMRIFDRQGRVRERSLLILRREGMAGAGDKSLIRFLSPNDIRGTSLLVWEHASADDERFLYLPAIGRVRRVAGEEKQQSFVGSDLSYEDIGGREIADYTYAFIDENATWTAPGGDRLAAWALESRAKDRNADYPRSVSIILKDRLMIVHADIYNQRNERAKIFDVKRLERVDGIWTALDLVVTNEIQKTRTALTTTTVRYNVGLTDEDFTRRTLEEAPR
jgi:hypothetical protein